MKYPIFLSGLIRSLKWAVKPLYFRDEESGAELEGSEPTQTRAVSVLPVQVSFKTVAAGVIDLKIDDFDKKYASAPKAEIESVALLVSEDFNLKCYAELVAMDTSGLKTRIPNVSSVPGVLQFIFPGKWSTHSRKKVRIKFDAPYPEVVWSGGIVIIDNIQEGGLSTSSLER